FHFSTLETSVIFSLSLHDALPIWNVIKVVWGSDWDSLITNDRDGILVRRLGEITDGQYQKYFVESGAYFRQNLFGTVPRLLKMVDRKSTRLNSSHVKISYAVFCLK